MKTVSHYTPSFIERCRVFVVAALLSSPALVTPGLYAQSNQDQGQVQDKVSSSVPAEFQVAFMPTESSDRLKLAITNPRNMLVRIKVLNQRGRSHYEGYERGEKLIVPFNFSGASPGRYTIDVSTNRGRQIHTFILEPPKPKRILPVDNAPGVLTTTARVDH